MRNKKLWQSTKAAPCFVVHHRQSPNIYHHTRDIKQNHQIELALIDLPMIIDKGSCGTKSSNEIYHGSSGTLSKTTKTLPAGLPCLFGMKHTGSASGHGEKTLQLIRTTIWKRNAFFYSRHANSQASFIYDFCTVAARGFQPRTS